jgi:hypothetical protein
MCRRLLPLMRKDTANIAVLPNPHAPAAPNNTKKVNAQTGQRVPARPRAPDERYNLATRNRPPAFRGSPGFDLRAAAVG